MAQRDRYLHRGGQVNLDDLTDPDHPASAALGAAYETRATAATGAFLRPDDLAADAAFAPLALATYDGGGKITHPSVYFNPAKWNGYRYWMAATPYDGTNTAIENPSIYVSRDGDTWQPAPGVTNPIDGDPGAPRYNSDTHLIEGRDGRLYCIWRRTGGPEPAEVIFYRASADGVNWSDKQTVWANDSTVRRALSPAVLWDGAQWVMYYVDQVPSPNVVRRVTSASLTGPWSAPTDCTVPVAAGRDAWHIDVKLVAGQFHLLLNDATLDSSGSSGRLYLCTSGDGVAFTRAATEIVPQRGAWHSVLYRSCLVPIVTAGGIGHEVFYGGIDTAANWKIGRTRALPRSPLADAQAVALAISGGISRIAPFLAADRFTRADGPLGAAESGQAWVTLAGAPVVAGNQAAASTAANTKAAVDLATADHYAEVAVPTLGTQAWLVARAVDNANHLRLGYSGGTLQLQKIVGGTTTALLPGNLGAFIAGDRIGLACSGATITVYRNSRALARVVDATLPAGTSAGWQTADTTTRFDNFHARALVPGE